MEGIWKILILMMCFIIGTVVNPIVELVECIATEEDKMISYIEYMKRVADTGDEYPLLSLDEFFEGNEDEYSIAPNQADEGRPEIAELYERFKDLENHDHIVWISVFLHDDTEINEDDEELVLYGDSIIICSDLSADEIEQLVDCEWLQSGGVSELNLEEYINSYPEVPEGYSCFEIMWD